MPTEQDILASLGITDAAEQQDIISGKERLLVLDASAHMDWDWLLPFPVLVTGGAGMRASTYFNGYTTGPVDSILTSAGKLLGSPDYHYSICETGFLRGYADSDPAGFQALLQAAAANGNLRIAGGGITSPDNLLPHGEAFIRCYLVGHAWLAVNAPGLPAPVAAWIPDDFGHDPELPVVLQAMGFMAAGFERIPGYTGGDSVPSKTIDGRDSVAGLLAASKIDFAWNASDGSSIVGHWLIGGYGQGNSIGTTGYIKGFLAQNLPVSPTPYIYVPVLSDFSMPNTYLTSSIEAWNGGGGGFEGTTVVAAAGSFEDYAQLVAFHAGELDTPYGSPFVGIPYWTGYFATRPELKIRHQRAARTLLAAEVFSIIAAWTQPSGGSAAAGTGVPEGDLLFSGWNLLAPSTHHDYITGTAEPDVYHTEQLGLLRQADATAAWLLRDAMQTIAGAIQTTAWGPAVAVFNPLGFARTEVAELSPADTAGLSSTVSGAGYQATPGGGLLFVASAPSLGYQTAYLTEAATPDNPATVTPDTSPVTAASVTLSNGLVSATLTPGNGGVWELTSVRDVAAGKELLQAGAVGNDLLFYADAGDEYRFGVESNDPANWVLTDVSRSLSNPTVEIVEAGPLRATVRTAVAYDDGTFSFELVREYAVVAGEPQLRMRTTGAAPLLGEGSSVVAAFPLAAGSTGIDTVVRGTPYHWTAVMPDLFWNGQTFLPTHDFVIPQSGTEALCAVYHASVPAWGISSTWNGTGFDPNDGVLYGCLWRNNSGHYFDWVQYNGLPLAKGDDPEVHVAEYALRVPSGLGTADTGQPLREALAFASPLGTAPVAPWTGQLADQLSLAGSSDDRAIVTAAKPGTVSPGDVVFRVYQPTNGALRSTLTLADQLAPGGATAVVRGQTALERDLDSLGQQQLDFAVTGTAVTFTATTALTTLAVTP
jgi:alpha-mannosidase